MASTASQLLVLLEKLLSGSCITVVVQCEVAIGLPLLRLRLSVCNMTGARQQQRAEDVSATASDSGYCFLSDGFRAPVLAPQQLDDLC